MENGSRASSTTMTTMTMGWDENEKRVSVSSWISKNNGQQELKTKSRRRRKNKTVKRHRLCRQRQRLRLRWWLLTERTERKILRIRAENTYSDLQHIVCYRFILIAHRKKKKTIWIRPIIKWIASERGDESATYTMRWTRVVVICTLYVSMLME